MCSQGVIGELICLRLKFNHSSSDRRQHEPRLIVWPDNHHFFHFVPSHTPVLIEGSDEARLLEEARKHANLLDLPILVLDASNALGCLSKEDRERLTNQESLVVIHGLDETDGENRNDFLALALFRDCDFECSTFTAHPLSRIVLASPKNKDLSEDDKIDRFLLRRFFAMEFEKFIL